MDRAITYQEALVLLVALVLVLIAFIGGIEAVRHYSRLCDSVPEVMVNACWGR